MQLPPSDCYILLVYTPLSSKKTDEILRILKAKHFSYLLGIQIWVGQGVPRWSHKKRKSIV